MHRVGRPAAALFGISDPTLRIALASIGGTMIGIAVAVALAMSRA